MAFENTTRGAFDGAPVNKQILNRDDSYTTSEELAGDAEKDQIKTLTKNEWMQRIHENRMRKERDIEKLLEERRSRAASERMQQAADFEHRRF